MLERSAAAAAQPAGVRVRAIAKRAARHQGDASQHAAKGGATASGPGPGSGPKAVRTAPTVATGPGAPGAAGNPVLHIGFEYEARDGRRFLLAPEHLPGARSRDPGGPAKPGSRQPGADARALLSRDLPLLLSVPPGVAPRGVAAGSEVDPEESGRTSVKGQDGTAGPSWGAGIAQLMRVWVATPDAPVSFAMQPTIRLQVCRGFTPNPAPFCCL